MSFFAKAVLRPPVRGGRKKIHVSSACLLSRLQQWQSGDLVSLWIDARNNSRCHNTVCGSSNQSQINTRHALFLASEGRFGDAMWTLRSCGSAPVNNLAFKQNKLYLRHLYSY